MKDMLKRLYRFLVTIDSEPEQVKTISIEEYNKTKQALEQANNKIISLEKANEDIINKNEITLAETEYIESEVRSIQIENILSRINNITDQERNKLQQTLVNSDLSVDFIEDTYKRISKTKKNNINRVAAETKLPQKSIPDKAKDFSYVR
jgi:hypothetical protein